MVKDTFKEKLVGILFVYIVIALLNHSYDPMQWAEIGKVIAAIIVFIIIID